MTLGIRELRHYLKRLSDTDTVDRTYLAEAVAVARHGPQQVRSEGFDLSQIASALPEVSTAEEAAQRLLVERACAELADPEDDRDLGRSALADHLGVGRRTVTRWLRVESTLSGPARKMIEKLVRLEWPSGDTS